MEAFTEGPDVIFLSMENTRTIYFEILEKLFKTIVFERVFYSTIDKFGGGPKIPSGPCEN